MSIHLDKLENFKQENLENYKAYFGLVSADYLNHISWQSLHTTYIINDKYNFKKRIRNNTIIFIKFPKNIIIKNSLIKHNNSDKIPFSDKEKTLLDKIYYVEYLKKKTVFLFDFDNLDFEKINKYLLFYKKYPLVKIKLISLLNKNHLKLLK